MESIRIKFENEYYHNVEKDIVNHCYWIIKDGKKITVDFTKVEDVTISMEKDIVLQDAYFHLCNSGLTIKMIENQHYENDDLEYVYHFLEFKNMCQGISNSYRIQIDTPDQIDYLISIFRSLKNRITSSKIKDAYFGIPFLKGLLKLREQELEQTSTSLTFEERENLKTSIEHYRKRVNAAENCSNRSRDSYSPPKISIKDGCILSSGECTDIYQTESGVGEKVMSESQQKICKKYIHEHTGFIAKKDDYHGIYEVWSKDVFLFKCNVHLIENTNDWHLEEDMMNTERKFTESDISQLQNEVYKITSDGDVMKLFNSLLGNQGC